MFAIEQVGGWLGSAVVYGEAASEGSHRGFVNRKTGRVIVTHDDARLRPWRAELVASMRACRPNAPLDEAVEVSLTVYVRRPMAHFGTGRNAGVLKSSAPQYPATGRDLDKVLRAVLDAGTAAGWYVDDSRVSRFREVLRLWDDGDGERVEVQARPMARAGR